MYEFDPRWTDDPRDRDDQGLRAEALAKAGRELSPGSRGGLSNPSEREPLDARDVFTRDLDLPRGHERERAWFDSHAHCIERGCESILARLDIAQVRNSFAGRVESRQIVALVFETTGEEGLEQGVRPYWPLAFATRLAQFQRSPVPAVQEIGKVGCGEC